MNTYDPKAYSMYIFTIDTKVTKVTESSNMVAAVTVLTKTKNVGPNQPDTCNKTPMEKRVALVTIVFDVVPIIFIRALLCVSVCYILHVA